MTKCVVGIVITYNPGDIRALLTALVAQCEHVIVVDNNSVAQPDVIRTSHKAGAYTIAFADNMGIAAAQNAGIDMARDLGATHVLLCDHDSLPQPGMVDALVDACANNAHVGAAGPLASEERDGSDQLVYVARTWKPGRATAEELRQTYVNAAFLIASGCLITMECLDDVGVMNEDLFIDHVDLEWGLRARKKGWKLVAVPHARMTHRLGDEAVVLPGRKQPVHVHSPIRNYYLARNTIWLIRQQGLAPTQWRMRYVWWLAKYAAFNALLVQPRRQRLHMLSAGIRDGIRGRMGALDK